MAYYQSGENIAYWVLDNSWSHQLLQHPCANCFYLEFSEQDPEVTTTYFPRGDKTIKSEEGRRSMSFTDPAVLTRQTVWAGKALNQYALQQVRLYGLWAGTLLGVVLTTGYWLLRNYRRSLKGLLQAGLARQQFIPFYQPVVDSQSGQLLDSRRCCAGNGATN